MTNSSNNLRQHLGKQSKLLLNIITPLAFLGFCDAAYLTIQHYLGAVVPCSLVGNCEAVLTSSYSTLLGVPVALFGALYYFALLFLSVSYRNTGDIRLFRTMFRLTWVGTALSLWFIYVQLFVLHQICIYCMVSASICILLFLLSARLFRLLKSSTKTV